jgi:hypothetical protein
LFAWPRAGIIVSMKKELPQRGAWLDAQGGRSAEPSGVRGFIAGHADGKTTIHAGPRRSGRGLVAQALARQRAQELAEPLNRATQS